MRQLDVTDGAESAREKGVAGGGRRRGNVSLQADPKVSSSWNAYAYAGNNPVGKKDRLGLLDDDNHENACTPQQLEGGYSEVAGECILTCWNCSGTVGGGTDWPGDCVTAICDGPGPGEGGGGGEPQPQPPPSNPDIVWDCSEEPGDTPCGGGFIVPLPPAPPYLTPCQEACRAQWEACTGDLSQTDEQCNAQDDECMRACSLSTAFLPILRDNVLIDSGLIK